MFISCSRKNVAQGSIPELDASKNNHAWYYFTDFSFAKTDLPQHAPAVLERPWTEAVRISSAATVPAGMNAGNAKAFAVVNRAGILAVDTNGPQLYRDDSIFSQDSAEGLVFSNGTPVFYLYRSTFFNEKLIAQFTTTAVHQQSAATQVAASLSRPFLVAFNMQSKLSFPLVSYTNLKLTDEDQITGYFWNGRTWACSVKKMLSNRVEFSYFSWEPLVPLVDLTPALSVNQFTFMPLTEDRYRSLNMPLLFKDAPNALKELLASLPKEFCFYISFRDNTGTSPISYYQEGNDTAPLNAHALLADEAGYTAALFEDGTTFIQEQDSKKITAFRLPKLPVGYTYGEFAIAGDTLYAAWEESNFYKTGRAGFLTVDLAQVLSKDE